MANIQHTSIQESVTLFRQGIERVLTNWTALKLAVEHGTGGPKSRELAADFVQYVGDIFLEGGNFEPEDVSDILVEVMDAQFDTWCEDNSPDEVASILCKLYSLYSQENLEELKKEIDNLPVLASHGKQGRSEQMENHDQEVDCAPTLAQVTEENENQEMDGLVDSPEEEPGWTHVKSRRKRIL